MSALAELRRTRATLSDPSRWRKGAGEGPDGERCVGLTIWDGSSTAAGEAARTLKFVLDLPQYSLFPLYQWNDDPNTTHADLMAALDRAIEVEGAREAEMAEAYVESRIPAYA